MATPIPPRGLRSLAGDSLVYGVSIAALPVALILATPVVTRKLGTSGFGTVDVLSGLVALASIAAGLGMDFAVARSWFDFDDARRRLDVVRTGVSVVGVVSALVAVVAAVAFVAASGDHVLAAAIAFGAMPFVTAQTIARLSFLLGRRRGLYLGVALVQALLGVGLALALVLVGAGVPGYFAGVAAGAAGALAITLVAGRLFAHGGTWLDRAELRRMLRFGLPLVPSAAGVWAVFAVDRTLVAALRSFSQAGLYGIGAKVTAPMSMLTAAFAVAWGPFILGQPAARRPELRARAFTALLAVTAALLVVLVLFAPQLVRLLGGHDFAPGRKAVPGVALGWLGWAAATVLATEFSVQRRTWPIAVATGVAATANVVLNLILIPRYGFVGAAWVTAGSFALLAAIYLVWERRLEPTPFRIGRLALIAIVAGVALLALLTPSLAARAIASVLAAAALLAVAASDRERA